MPFGLGFFATSAVAPAAAGSYDLLATEILTSSQASVTFSSLNTLAAGYQHLQIRYAARSTRASGDTSVLGYFNSDQGSNYSNHRLRAPISGAVNSSGAASQTWLDLGECPADTATSSMFAAGVVDILDPFESSKNTVTKAFNGSTLRIVLQSGAWYNTNPVSSITLYTYAGNIAQYSRFSLYGLKGA